MDTFRATYERLRSRVEEALEVFLPAEGEGPPRLREAMRYSLMAGGKRIRPVLLLAAYELHGGEREEAEALPLACALEMIHTFTLIHDDLPAMDNDDFRRGRPTNHRVFGEAMAILAGDALFSHALATALQADLPPDRMVWALRILLEKTGLDGVIGGQVYDLEGEGQPPSLEKVRIIHERKTAALIQAPLMMGAVAAGASLDAVQRMGQVGYHLGMAFQMVDDYLDEVGDVRTLGKTPGKDREQGKMTYPAVRGLEGTLEDARKEVEQAWRLLDEGYGERGWFLKEIGAFILRRVS